MAISIHTENSEDHAAIRNVTAAAFGRDAETKLVDALRADSDSVISLVALEGDEIVAHVQFSRMAEPAGALGLGPVSVRPDRQMKGIGTRLIRAGLDRAREAGWRWVIVLGEPAYYGRFGFDAAPLRNFVSPFAGVYLQALALNQPLPEKGTITYAPAFSRFE